MKRWEYKTVKLNSAVFKSANVDAEMLQRKCNGYGKEGWELVNFQNYDMSTKFMLIFKREIIED